MSDRVERIGSAALLDGNTVLHKRIRAYEKETGLKFPMTEHQALRLHGIGKKGLRIMQILGLVEVDWKRVAGNIAALERRAAWFNRRAALARKQIKELRASMPSVKAKARRP